MVKKLDWAVLCRNLVLCGALGVFLVLFGMCVFHLVSQNRLRATETAETADADAANAASVDADVADDETADNDEAGAEGVNGESNSEAGADGVRFVLNDLGDAIRAKRGFEYPKTLEEVEKSVQDAGGWETHKLYDSYELSYSYFTPDQPHLTPEEAMQLKNETPETNAQIAGAYQRLPDPEGLSVEDDFPGVDYEQKLYRHISTDVGSFNPLFFNTSADAEVIRYTQTALFNTRYDNLEYVGNSETIVSWESSADHKMDKIVLRDDLLWSDGTPLTAYDWEFSYKVIMSSAVPIFGIRSGVDQLLGVKAYDARTLVFFHQEPTPISPQNMAYYIIPQHIYEKSIKEDPTLTRTEWHQKQEHAPITSGPYVVVKHQPGTAIVLERNENYYSFQGKMVRKRPFLKQIHFQISPDSATAFMQLKNGDLQVMALLPEQWLTQATTDDFYRRNTKASAVSWNYFAFWFNQVETCPYFQDIRVRKALSFAFDYDEMLRVHRKGLDMQSRGIFSETSPFFPKEANLPYLKQDYAEARRLLTEAGWTDTDQDGLLDHEWNGKRIPFQFTIVTTNMPESVELCNLFARCLKHLGIDCSVQAMEFNVLCQREVEHKFQMSLGGWLSGGDPYSNQNIWGTGEGRNFICYSNAEVDELFRKGLLEFDRPKRIEIYKKIHVLIHQDYPCIWLFSRNTSTAFNKNLRGIGFYFGGASLSETWFESSSKNKDGTMNAEGSKSDGTALNPVESSQKENR